MSYIEQVGLVFVVSVIVLVSFFVLWLLFGKFERSCYDAKHEDSRDDDQDYRVFPRTCCNCQHGEISTDFPKVACPIQGKHMEPNDGCAGWQ